MRLGGRRLSLQADEGLLRCVALARERKFAAALELLAALKAQQPGPGYARLLSVERVCRLGAGDAPGLRDTLAECLFATAERFSEGSALLALRNLFRAHLDCGEAAQALALAENAAAVLKRPALSPLFARELRLLAAEARLMAGEAAAAREALAALRVTEFDLETSAEAVNNHAASCLLAGGELDVAAVARGFREAIMLLELAAFEPVLGAVEDPRGLVAAAQSGSSELAPLAAVPARRESAELGVQRAALSAAPSEAVPGAQALSADLQLNRSLREQMLAALAAPSLGPGSGQLRLRNPRSVHAVAGLVRLYLEAENPEQAFRWCNIGLVTCKALRKFDVLPSFLFAAFVIFKRANRADKAEENLRLCIELSAARGNELLKLAVRNFLDFLAAQKRWYELHHVQLQLQNESCPALKTLTRINAADIWRPMLILPEFVFK